MSHNLHRVPTRLREKAAREMADVRDPNDGKPHRRFRRRPSFLSRDHARRQTEKRWLETHIWHAKRMRMIERWGVVLAEKPNDKSIRSLYRAELTGCTIHDASYHDAIELRGSADAIELLLARMTSPNASSTASSVRSGHRAANNVCLYAVDEYPCGYLAPCSLVWNVHNAYAELANESEATENAAHDVQLFVFVHVSAYDAVLEALQAIADVAAVAVSALRR
jgi:ribonuclease P/MRP protein subunit POP1